MIRTARKYEVMLTTANIRLETTQKLKEQYGKSPHFSEIIEQDVISGIYNYNVSLMRTKGVINLYVKECKKEFGTINFNFYSKESSLLLQEARIILNNCIESGFLMTKDGDKEQVYITVKGKKFADQTCIGLLKEWAKEIGKLWGGLAWIISIITAANFRSILNFLLRLFSDR